VYEHTHGDLHIISAPDKGSTDETEPAIRGDYRLTIAMKVLDPQSALLTNAEVYQFLQSNPARKAEKQTGAYSSTNLTGYNAIREDVSRYRRIM